ncbi:ABC transporter ATP-binding protein/permease [Tropicimonas sp. IMCC34011]|uniref:ABCB family ABC transporter ATP-binding protein/permease n=1 Tax=Tropicimonas sp. IMCC34011 TaxID=2248759 RepID=UPI000E22F472
MSRDFTSQPPDDEKDLSASAEGKRGMRVIRDAAPYLWPRGNTPLKVRTVAALAVLVLAKLVAVGTPLIYKSAVDALAGDTPQDAGMLLALGAVGLTVAYGTARLLGTAFTQLRDMLFARVAQNGLRRLGLRTFRHIHRMSLRYHMERRTGALSRIMDRGVKGVAFLLRFLVFSIGPLIFELALICIILTTLFDARFLLVMGVVLAAYVAFTFIITEWRVKIRREMNRQDNAASQSAIDSLLNFETVKYFGAENREAVRYDTAMAAYEGAALKTSYSLGAINAGQALIVNAGLVTGMAMAARGVSTGEMTVGDFVMVNSYMLQVIMPLNFLGSVYREIRQALVDMGQMFDLLDHESEVTDSPGARALEVSGGRVRFEGVRFAYDPDRPILQGIDLEIPPGGTLAVVGPSGAGKSTLARLLFRFYDPGAGRITIDGQDLRDVTQTSLREALGVVPQDTVLFNDTIGYNIAYGREGAGMDEVEQAAREAGLHDFIASLPLGYDTRVGERGLKLSGGEKQRVGIARTLLKDPPILILDEATSALDTHTELQIRRSLARAGEGRSVMIVAHRLSTIAHADRIAVLNHGRVIEAGSHEMLLAKGGHYAAMWAAQDAGASDDPETKEARA